jgi:hypothetical protein
MTVIADYSCARPDLASLKAAGAVGIARYLAPLPNRCGTGGLAQRSKVIDAAEYKTALDLGLTVTLMWEWTNNRSLDGATAGTADGSEAARQAHLLGHEAPVYAILEDPERVDVRAWPKVDAYARAFAAAFGGVIGGYGSQALLEVFIERGVIGYGMQVGNWSAGVSSACHLYQRLNPSVLTAFAGSIDENAILKPDYGQVPRPADAPKGGPVVQQLAAPICAGVIRPQEDGYWLIGRDGGIFAFGQAPAFEPHLVTPDGAQEIIDAKCTPTGSGLYLFGADGGVFTFGDARFQGSLPASFGASSLPPRG